jgi:hypothetical protein
MPFDRQYRLEIAKPVTKDIAFPLNENMLSGSRGTSLILTDHQITFEIKKTSGAALNQTKIEISNLSPDSFGFISNFRGQEVYLKLVGGYVDDIKTLLTGQVVAVGDTFEGHTRKTEITVTEGFTNAKEARSSFSFLPGTLHSIILSALMNDLGLPQGIIIRPKTITKAPWSWEGKTIEALKKLALDTNSSFSLQNSTIHFTPHQTKDLVTVNKYTPTTGLIGSPSALSDASNVPQDNKSAPKVGIKFKVDLDGSLLPDTLVKIESREYEGVFRIHKVKHRGDYRGTTWVTECEASQLSPFIEGEV